jgi:hypothetical protein
LGVDTFYSTESRNKVDFKIDAKFYSHCSSKFLKIMEIAKVSPTDISRSLELAKNEMSVFKAGEG